MPKKKIVIPEVFDIARVSQWKKESKSENTSAKTFMKQSIKTKDIFVMPKRSEPLPARSSNTFNIDLSKDGDWEKLQERLSSDVKPKSNIVLDSSTLKQPKSNHFKPIMTKTINDKLSKFNIIMGD
jgi:hypothetical protein